MKTICAWCQAVLNDGEEPVSHGICADCRDTFLQHQGVSLQSFIDGFSFPILVLNGNLDVVSLNIAVADSAGLDRQEVQHLSIGEVVECKHSRSPEGCGRTIHCTGCVLRNSVTETNATGLSLTMIPAAVNTATREIQLYVSTIKLDGSVFVKLDKA